MRSWTWLVLATTQLSASVVNAQTSLGSVVQVSCVDPVCQKTVLTTPSISSSRGQLEPTIRAQTPPMRVSQTPWPTGRFLSHTFTYPSQYEGELRPEQRSFGFYVPDNVQPGEKVPLVVGLHGYGQNCWAFAEQSGLIDLAKQHRFAFLCPNAMPNIGPISRRTALSVDRPPALNMRGWNAGSCCGDPKRDDASFVLDLVDQISTSAPIDRQHVVAIGFSNGGDMGMRLVCEHPEIFSGVGVAASTQRFDSCPNAKPIPFMQIQGTKDPWVPAAGGQMWFPYQLLSWFELGSWPVFRSVRDMYEEFVKRNQKKNGSEERAFWETPYADPRVVCTRQDGEAPTVLCMVIGMGHQFPGELADITPATHGSGNPTRLGESMLRFFGLERWQR